MNKKLIAVLLLVASSCLFVGCASTAEGIKQDYKKMEDKV